MVSTRFLSKRTLAATLSLAVAALAGLWIMPGNDAEATPTLAETEHTLADLGAKLDAVNEQYNKANALLKQSQERQAALLKQVAPYQAKADEYQKKVAGIGAAAYRGGRPSVLSAIIRGDSPQTVVDQLGVIDQLTRDQQGVIDKLKEARKPIEATQAKLDAEIAVQAKQEKELRDRKTQLNTDMATWTALRNKLTPRSTRSTSRQSFPVYDGAASGRAAVVVKYAYAQLGHRYVFGAAGENGNFDCSGLSLAAWRQVGVSMEHSAHVQYASFPKVSTPQAGDLVFFYSGPSHVGVYVGNGYMIHAPQPGDPIQRVNINTSYWQGIYKGAVRPS